MKKVLLELWESIWFFPEVGIMAIMTLIGVIAFPLIAYFII
jgi:hypothetical protein